MYHDQVLYVVPNLQRLGALLALFAYAHQCSAGISNRRRVPVLFRFPSLGVIIKTVIPENKAAELFRCVDS